MAGEYLPEPFDEIREDDVVAYVSFRAVLVLHRINKEPQTHAILSTFNYAPDNIPNPAFRIIWNKFFGDCVRRYMRVFGCTRDEVLALIADETTSESDERYVKLLNAYDPADFPGPPPDPSSN